MDEYRTYYAYECAAGEVDQACKWLEFCMNWLASRDTSMSETVAGGLSIEEIWGALATAHRRIKLLEEYLKDYEDEIFA